MLARSIGKALCAAAASLASAGIAAQELPARKKEHGSAVELDRLIVTARRRDEAAADVPMSLTTLDANELQSRGIDDIGALNGASPNLVIYPTRDFNGTVTAYIRGVGQSNPLWSADPGVAVYLDDVYLARPQGALLDILDVERVEVLRGPQGTLYGKNSVGGVIKVVTRAPAEDFGGSLSMTLGDFARRDLRAVVNIPLGERLRTRAAIASFDRDGFGRNLLTGEQVSARDTAVARLNALWAPAEDLAVRVSYDRTVDRSGPQGAQRLAVNIGDPAQTPPDPGRYDVRSEAPNLMELDSEGGSATVDWTIDPRWRLRSISAYREGHSRAYTDFDTLPIQVTLYRRLGERQTSQEFQLHRMGERSQGVVGLYFSDGIADGILDNLTLQQRFGRTQGSVGTRGAALFGSWSHALGATMALDLGLRYDVERKAIVALNQSYADAFFTVPIGAPSADFSDSKTYRALSPSASLSWRPAEQAMFYLRAARGFKSGTYNIRATTAIPESERPLEPEWVTSYELGAKAQWLEGRLDVRAAAFHNAYDDIQLSVFTSYDSDGNGTRDRFFADFRNAGSGTIRGSELEATLRTGNVLRWSGNVGYLDPRYDRFISRDSDIAGSQRFTNAPRWTLGVSLVADVPLRIGGWLQARLDGRYQSKTYPTTDLSEAIAQPGYAVWNASVAWTSPMQRWQLALRGQNLFDKAYRVTGFNISLPDYSILTGYYGPLRTLALSLEYAF